MKFHLLNIDGTKPDSIEISDKLVKIKVNYKLIKYVIDWQLNHAKPRVAKTKQRNQIKGSTRKIVAQKGSGGARHASNKAPLFVGGGVAVSHASHFFFLFIFFFNDSATTELYPLSLPDAVRIYEGLVEAERELLMP